MKEHISSIQMIELQIEHEICFYINANKADFSKRTRKRYQLIVFSAHQCFVWDDQPFVCSQECALTGHSSCCSQCMLTASAQCGSGECCNSQCRVSQSVHVFFSHFHANLFKRSYSWNRNKNKFSQHLEWFQTYLTYEMLLIFYLSYFWNRRW